MKYYKGTRKRKKSSKSKPNDSNTDVDQTKISQSHLAEQEKAIGKKRPISTYPSAHTEEQSTGRAKRAKTTHTKTSQEESSNKKKDSKILDSSDENEPTSRSSKKRPQRSSSNRSNSNRSRVDSNSDGISNKVPLAKKRMKSKETKESNSERLLEDSKTRKTSENLSETVHKKAKSSTKRKHSEKETLLSETPDSAFEDNEEEEQNEGKEKEAETNLEDSSGDISSDGFISYREFLQQQVRILKSTFEVEDCPELVVQGTKRQQKNHIPRDVILKVLRKLNYKVEDELLKTLNRQAQRKILKQIDEIRSAHNMTRRMKSKEQQSEGDTEVLKKTLEESTQELNGVKKLTDMAGKIEQMAEIISNNPLAEEVKHTNELVQKIHQKLKKKGFTNCQLMATPKGPLSHKQIVEKLFS